jgi:cell wall-associated NlpC family hydrolase
MRWLISSSITLSLATGAVIPVAEEEPKHTVAEHYTEIGILESHAIQLGPKFASVEYFDKMLADEQAEIDRIIAEVAKAKHRQDVAKNTIAMEERIRLLEKHVGKTWYVFAGSTPRGWDCSGLVKWFYKGLGVNLYHSASTQKRSGVIVDTPKRGDLVAFGDGPRTAGHIGIYISEDVMIHVGRPGQKTAYRSISKFGSNYRYITYTRILETE